MLFPKSRMQVTSTFAGRTVPEGWLVLDLKGADMDGVTKLYLSMEDIEKLKAGGDTAAQRLEQARRLFGGGGDEDETTSEDAE